MHSAARAPSWPSRSFFLFGGCTTNLSRYFRAARTIVLLERFNEEPGLDMSSNMCVGIPCLVKIISLITLVSISCPYLVTIYN